MASFDTLFLFLAVFASIFVVKVIYEFIVSLLSNPPKKLILSKREVLYLGLSMSYLITYIIKLFQ